jgi:ABC-type glycerol-3-phosphate transport system substrate-binding protein
MPADFWAEFLDNASNLSSKNIIMKLFSKIFGFAILMLVGLSACKNKADRDKDTTTTTTTSADSTTSTAPVVVESDDALVKGAKDATKDYPDVTATVSNGEITLTGEIKRDKLPDLMQSLNSLNPKKINNNLTIK